MLQLFRGEETGIYFIDSTKLSICHTKRISNNKVFGNIAKIGMSSYGWFVLVLEYRVIVLVFAMLIPDHKNEIIFHV
ncbi:MAG: transposase [Rickettsia endosymbiont of Argas persicus]